MIDLLIAKYLHFLSILMMIVALAANQWLVRRSITYNSARQVVSVNRLFWIGLALAAIVGLVLWFLVGKPAEFYTKNWIFHTKLTLFVVSVLIFLYPTLAIKKLMKQATPDQLIQVPILVIIGLRLALFTILIIPLLAHFVALGFGAF